MSDIDLPSNIPRPAGEGTGRVTRPATASDDNSSQQQGAQKQAANPEKPTEIQDRPVGHEPAVTLSASLSGLEVGSRTDARYLGLDGEKRPLITAQSGTYVVRFEPAFQDAITRLPAQVPLELEITSRGRTIEAQLIYQIPNNPAQPAQDNPDADNPPRTYIVPVTLELTGLAAGHRQKNPHTPVLLPVLPGTYQAADLYRASHGAQASTHNHHDLLLPPTTNYTLYEKAVPRPDRPPAVIQSRISGNALIAQEHQSRPVLHSPQNHPTAAGTSPTIPPPAETTPAVESLEKLLQKPLFATIIKNIPQTGGALSPTFPIPDALRQQIAAPGPLDHFLPGHGINLRVTALAIPDKPETRNPEIKNPEIKNPEIRKTESGNREQQPSPVTKPETTASELSGIVIAPGKHIAGPIPYRDSFAAKRDQTLKNIYVATPSAVIKFQSATALSPGTILNFSLETTSPSAPLQAATPSPVLPLPLQPLADFTENWAALSQILSVLSTSGTGTAALAGRLPHSSNPAHMTTAMVFFLAALGAARPARLWLGPDGVAQLERAGQSRLLDLLDQDMQRIARLGRDVPVNEWRPVLLPLQVGQDIQAIPLLTRQIPPDLPDKDSEDGTEEEATPTTRFMVEVQLSQWGTLQVDGLLKPQKLDIILRSLTALPDDIKTETGRIFTTALETNGYSGSLQFRDGVRPDISVKHIINQHIYESNL